MHFSFYAFTIQAGSWLVGNRHSSSTAIKTDEREIKKDRERIRDRKRKE